MSDIDLSIIICAYNAAKYLESTLESLRLQAVDSDLRFETILVDDGSQDNTAQIANHQNVVYLYQDNQGIEAASKAGLATSRGKFVMRLDADDKLRPNFLKFMGPELIRNEAAFYYGNYRIIDHAGHKVSSVGLPDFDFKEIQRRGDFLATGTVYRRELLERYGFYDCRRANCGLENYELILTLIHDGYIGKHINQEIFEYRIHPENLSSGKLKEIVEYGLYLAEKFSLPAYRTNEFHPYGLEL